MDTGTTLDALIRAVGPKTAAKLKDRPLREISALCVSDLVAEYGLTTRAAQRTRAVFDLAPRIMEAPLERGATMRDGADIYRHFAPKMKGLMVEQFWTVLLDGKHRFMHEQLISQGTLTSSPVHPREVFATAIRRSAAAIVLAHNHPSGDPAPSADDIEITSRLSETGRLIGIRVVDHVIIGDAAYVSFSDRGLLSR